MVAKGEEAALHLMIGVCSEREQLYKLINLSYSLLACFSGKIQNILTALTVVIVMTVLKKSCGLYMYVYGRSGCVRCVAGLLCWAGS